MKAKQLVTVLFVLVALGGIALLLNRRNAASWSNTATVTEGKILTFPLNDVSQITIKGAGAELNLTKKNDTWRVAERADYPADFDKVSALLRKLWELRPVQDVKIGPSQLDRLQLTEPGQTPGSEATLLDLKATGDKRLAALLLGKKHLRNTGGAIGEGGGVPTGRYVMEPDASKRVFLIAETLDEAQTKPEQWLSRDFVKVENPKSIAIAGATPAMNWKLERETASTPWKFANAKPGEELDSSKASGLASLLAYGAFADVLAPDAPPAETGLDQAATAKIETFDNFVYDLRIGKAMGENYPVLVSVKAELPKERTPAPDEKPEDKAKLEQEFLTRQKQLNEKLAKEQALENRPYLIAKATIDQLLKERSALVPEKKPDPSPAAGVSPGTAAGAPSTKPSGVAASPAPSRSPARKPPK
jgi:hypothetical protein